MNAENTIVCTATGAVLASRLASLVPQLISGQIPASIGRKLSIAMDKVDSRMARKAALTAATAILNAEQGLCRWALAQSLESALSRFEAVGYSRVKAGHRQPSELETHLLVLLESDGPRCSHSLWREMGLFDLPK